MGKMRTRFAVMISVAWVTSLVDAVVNHKDGPVVLGLVTPVMLVVVTAMFALRNGKNGNGSSE